MPRGKKKKETSIYDTEKDLEFLKSISSNKAFLRFFIFCLVIGLNWVGLSAVYKTAAYFTDMGESPENAWQAGILDFELRSDNDFLPSLIDIEEETERTISIINLGNNHKYKITATNFSAGVCDYLYLEASLNQGDILYSGLLKDFVDFGPTVFEDPADWNFVLTLPADAPQEVLGQTCDFNFVFFGSQTRHDLPFGTGFTDTEQISSSIATAICYDTEIRSMGYWKTHSDVYKPYLPQYLGGYSEGEIIDTVEKAQQVFYDSPTPMENMLKKHLLAMKFNLAHFGIGEYLVESEGKTLNQIVTDADTLLLDPEATKDDLEIMKDLLDDLNALGQIRYCYVFLPEIEVIVPDGGEQWWVGQHYDITWQSSNLDCPNDESEVSIWYSADSGTTWANIVQSADNNGTYNWRAPLFLNGYYVPSSNARIKIVARCSQTQTVVAWDMSDNDFCPPIDYDLLTPEEIELLKDMGMIAEEAPETEEAEEETGEENEQMPAGGAEDENEEIINESEEATTQETDEETGATESQEEETISEESGETGSGGGGGTSNKNTEADQTEQEPADDQENEDLENEEEPPEGEEETEQDSPDSKDPDTETEEVLGEEDSVELPEGKSEENDSADDKNESSEESDEGEEAANEETEETEETGTEDNKEPAEEESTNEKLEETTTEETSEEESPEIEETAETEEQPADLPEETFAEEDDAEDNEDNDPSEQDNEGSGE